MNLSRRNLLTGFGALAVAGFIPASMEQKEEVWRRVGQITFRVNIDEETGKMTVEQMGEIQWSEQPV